MPRGRKWQLSPTCCGERKFGSLSRIIRPDRLDLLSMSPVAFSTHTDNGLLFELMGRLRAQ